MNNSSLRILLLIACIGGFWWWWGKGIDLSFVGAGGIDGRAIDGQGRAVVGADIVLRDERGRIVRHATTTEQGRFTFSSCRPGEYRIAAAKPDVGGGNRLVNVKRGQKTKAYVPLLHSNASIRLN